MSNTNSAVKLTRKSRGESRVILFGNPADESVSTSIRKLESQGREVHTKLRPDFDTGLGMCGSHLCHCKEYCKATF